MKRIILSLMVMLTLIGTTPHEVAAFEPANEKVGTVAMMAPYIIPDSIAISPTQTFIFLGTTRKLEVPAVYDKARLRWVSDKPSIISVDSDGNIKGNKIGTATIRVAYAGMTAKVTITVTLPDIIAFKAARYSNTALKVSWAKVPSASGYVVYRSSSPTGKFKAVKTVTKGTTVSFTNTRLKSGTTYYYKVRAYKTVSGKKIYGNYTDVVAAATLKTPVVTVKSSQYNQLTVSWKKIKGANAYEIYRSDSKNGTYALVGTVTGNSNVKYVDDVTHNNTFYYKVRAIKNLSGFNSCSGAFSTIKSAKAVLKSPVIAVKAGDAGVDITWTAVTGENAGYEVYRATSEKGKYMLLGLSTTASYLDTTAVSGKTYYYKVRAKRQEAGPATYSGYSAVKSIVFLAKVTDFTATKDTAVNLTWGKVTSASGYVIQRSVDGGATFTTLTTTTSGSTLKYTDKKVTAGQSYVYRIRAYKTVGNTKKYGAYSTLVPITF